MRGSALLNGDHRACHTLGAVTGFETKEPLSKIYLLTASDGQVLGPGVVACVYLHIICACCGIALGTVVKLTATARDTLWPVVRGYTKQREIVRTWILCRQMVGAWGLERIVYALIGGLVPLSSEGQ